MAWTADVDETLEGTYGGYQVNVSVKESGTPRFLETVRVQDLAELPAIQAYLVARTEEFGYL